MDAQSNAYLARFDTAMEPGNMYMKPKHLLLYDLGCYFRWYERKHYAGFFEGEASVSH